MTVARIINLKLIVGPSRDFGSSLVGCRWTQAAGGASGRANVGLCPASSYPTYADICAVTRRSVRARSRVFSPWPSSVGSETRARTSTGR